jgi:hypothetical protein
MDSQSERSSSARKWWLLIGGVVVFVVAIDLLESLLRTESTPAENGSTPAGETDAATSPARPELRVQDDGAIEIRHGFFQRSTIRVGNDKDQEELLDCLTRGIEQMSEDGIEGWDRERVRQETRQIQDECLAVLRDVPVPPRPPQPGD